MHFLCLYITKRATFGRSQCSFVTGKSFICIGFPIWFVMKVENAAAPNYDNTECNVSSAEF